MTDTYALTQALTLHEQMKVDFRALWPDAAERYVLIAALVILSFLGGVLWQKDRDGEKYDAAVAEIQRQYDEEADAFARLVVEYDRMLMDVQMVCEDYWAASQVRRVARGVCP